MYLLVNILARSVTMSLGGPCFDITLSNSSCIISWDVILLRVAIKCPILVNLSMITSIASCPLASGNCVIISIDIEVQGWSGTGNGWRRPYFLCRATLFLWHTSHDNTYLWINL